jgi:hypothetical protein
MFSPTVPILFKPPAQIANKDQNELNFAWPVCKDLGENYLILSIALEDTTSRSSNSL